MDDLDGKAPESGGIIQESPSIRLIDKKCGLRDECDNEYDSEANFRHGWRKGHETITPTNIGVSFRDDFFDDIESCSIEPTNLDDVALFYLFCQFPFIRDNILISQFSIPHLSFFFQIGEFDLV